MIVNFRIRGINRGRYKLIQKLILIIIKKKARGTEPKCQRELTLKKLALKKFANHYRFLSFLIVMKYFYLLLLLSQVK